MDLAGREAFPHGRACGPVEPLPDDAIAVLRTLDAAAMARETVRARTALDGEELDRILDALEAERLVAVVQDDAGTLYYQVTWRGKRRLHPERLSAGAFLSAALGLTAGGAALLLAGGPAGLRLAVACVAVAGLLTALAARSLLAFR